MEPDTVYLNINGILDLHTFNPKEVKDLVPDYLQACFDKEIYDIRIIHGKGSGALRRTVHSILDRLEIVKTYKLAPENAGSWGATLVSLKTE